MVVWEIAIRRSCCPRRNVVPRLVYHVINRGNSRQAVFDSEGDYRAFVKATADLKQRTPFDPYGYCLMSNHLLDPLIQHMVQVDVPRPKS